MKDSDEVRKLKQSIREDKGKLRRCEDSIDRLQRKQSDTETRIWLAQTELARIKAAERRQKAGLS